MLFISPQKLFSFQRYLTFCFDVLVGSGNPELKKQVKKPSCGYDVIKPS